MPAVDLRIIGRVQGVFFRARTKDIADRLGLTGWVKNEIDGSVVVHAEGSDKQLGELEEWCRRGPPAADVSKVMKQETVEGGHTTFEIRY